MIVTIGDFNKIPYSIPNASRLPSFMLYMDVKEEDFLTEMLGIDFVESLYSGLQNEEPEWELLANRYLKKMLIARIYASWLSDTYDNHSDVGINISNNENSESISPARRIANAINFYADEAVKVKDFLTENQDDYPDFEWTEPEKVNIFNI